MNRPDAEPLHEIDFTSKITDSLDFSHVSLADAIGKPLGARHAVAIEGVYTAESVVRVVTALRANPKPVYPRAFAASSIEATFLVEFVVDSTRRVENRSVQFPVAALVSQEFVFRLGRGSSCRASGARVDPRLDVGPKNHGLSNRFLIVCRVPDAWVRGSRQHPCRTIGGVRKTS